MTTSPYAYAQAVADFLARGGQITRLPPCCAALKGAVPRASIDATGAPTGKPAVFSPSELGVGR